MPSLDRHFEGDGAIFDVETLRGENPAAADGQQPFGGAERRLHQDLGHIAWLVRFFVGDQVDLFLLDLAGGGQFPAADPAGEAGSGSGGPARR